MRQHRPIDRSIGWIAKYPTLEHLKKFFKKNEFGHRVLDHIPFWYTDARRIVEVIEIQLYPLESYMKARKGSFSTLG